MKYVLVNLTDTAVFVHFQSGQYQMLCSNQMMVYDSNVELLSEPAIDMIESGVLYQEELVYDEFFFQCDHHDWLTEGF